MYRVRYGRKKWRTRWPWTRLFPLRVDDRFCPKCGLPYHNGPLPKEVTQFTEGNVGACIYPSGTFRRRSFAVKFGRWRSGSRELYLSDFIDAEELDDLFEVAALARDFVTGRESARAVRRWVGS